MSEYAIFQVLAVSNQFDLRPSWICYTVATKLVILTKLHQLVFITFLMLQNLAVD